MSLIDQILSTNKKTATLEEIEATSSIERAYSSSVRNIIILFTLGITILRFSKNNLAYVISIIFVLSGIAMGIVAFLRKTSLKELIKLFIMNIINIIW